MLRFVPRDDSVRIAPGSGAAKLAGSRVLLMALAHDVADTLPEVRRFADSVAEVCADFRACILENASTDGTKDALARWAAEDPRVHVEFVDAPACRTLRDDGTPFPRTSMMAEYRNACARAAVAAFGGSDRFDLVVVLDADAQRLCDAAAVADALDLDEDFDVVACNGVYSESTLYYDEFALRWPGDPRDITCVHPEFSKHYGRSSAWLARGHVVLGWARASAAFGGLALLPGRVLDDPTPWGADQPPEECEHLQLCERLGGKVFVAPGLAFSHRQTPDGLVPQATVLLPRDAGFFSVVNFFAGSVLQGCRPYPLWNSDAAFRGTTPVHFRGCGDGDRNGWDDFFRPVKHALLGPEPTVGPFASVGVEAPTFIRIPAEMHPFLRSSAFESLRPAMHAIHERYLVPNDRVAALVDRVWKRVSEGGDCVIGVHYRNPVHCVEQGDVLLSAYFDALDAQLEERPGAAVFLATDTELGVLAFSARYGDRVRYVPDTTRSSLDDLLTWAYRGGRKASDAVGLIDGKGYEVHTRNVAVDRARDLRLSTEVLVDALCLSRCDAVVGSSSNVSMAVGFMNPRAKMIFVGT